MPKKPCILTNLIGVLGSRTRKNLCTEEDFIVLEDSSGRIKIKKTDKIKPEFFITGSIVGFLG
jgi:hypothetical protein